MLKILALSFALICCGSHKPHKSSSSIEILQQRKDYYVSEIDKHAIYHHRCDKLTFRGLLSAFGPRQAVEEHEIEPGKFRRDVIPCFPHDSRSSISLDGYLGVMHHAITYEDWGMVQRIDDYARRHRYIMGEGPIEYTNILVLAPILSHLAGNHALGIPKDISDGYRGHVAAILILLRGRTYGRLNNAELFALKKLHDLSPKNPLYAAAYHRFSDGDQTEAQSILLRDFTDSFPETTARYGWGSAPDSVFFIVTMGIIEGK